MKKLLVLLFTVFLLGGIYSQAGATAIDFLQTAGDEDYGADRDDYDDETNMDYFVFQEGQGLEAEATNSLGYIEWTYSLPYSITEAYSGYMTIHAWDIDTGDDVEVYFDYGAGEVYAGNVSGSNGGNYITWENAVAAGTTASLSGWSTSTFTLSADALAALANTTEFTLRVYVEEAAADWAVVIDYATLYLNYEAGEENPNYGVPEPATLILLGTGLMTFAGIRRKISKG